MFFPVTMDVRLAVISLLLFFGQKVMPIQGQGCVEVQEIWTNINNASLELLCSVNGERKLWRGTDRCDLHSFTAYNNSLTSFIVPRSDYDKEPVTIICCSRGEDLASNDLCYQIMICTSATINVPPVVVAGKQERVYINHIAKPPTLPPIPPPSLSVTLIGPNLTHLDSTALHVTTRVHRSTAIETIFIFSFQVPDFLPNTTQIRFQPSFAKRDSPSCVTPRIYSNVSVIDVLFSGDGGRVSTQPTLVASTVPDTDKPCTCPVGIIKPGVAIAIGIISFFVGIVLATIATSCTVFFTCYNKRKTKEMTSSSQNGGTAQPRVTPLARPHPSNLPLKRGTPTEEDKLIPSTSSNLTDTPITNRPLSNGHTHRVHSFGIPNGGIEVEASPMHPSHTSHKPSPTTPLSCRNLPLPSPLPTTEQPLHTNCTNSRSQPSSHYEVIGQCSQRKVDVFGGREKETTYSKQGNKLSLRESDEHSEAVAT